MGSSMDIGPTGPPQAGTAPSPDVVVAGVVDNGRSDRLAGLGPHHAGPVRAPREKRAARSPGTTQSSSHATRTAEQSGQ